ncbi:MAG: DUF370 domain-containing protein [Eubacteriales bacterium]|nr:DUF370 domain-containing protein [Eubacteriales bacterium]
MSKTEAFIDIGQGNYINAARILVGTGAESSPIKRMIIDARDRGTLIDASGGKKTRSVLVFDSDHVVLSALESEAIVEAIRTAVNAEGA